MTRTILFTICIYLALSSRVLAQDSSSYPPFDQLRSDFRQVAVVAHVRVKETKVIEDDGIYLFYITSCQVIEPLKGKVKRKDLVNFFVQAEKSPRTQFNKGDLVVFLEKTKDKHQKKWGYAALENSTLKYSPKLVRQMRKIKALGQQAKPSKDRKPTRP